MSQADSLLRREGLENEFKQYIMSQYIEGKTIAGFGEIPIKVENGAIAQDVTQIATDNSSISVLNTFYGVSLSNALQIEYNKDKVQQMIRELLRDYACDEYGSSLYEYALTEYATILLIVETDYPLTKKERTIMVESANAGLEQIEYSFDNCYTPLILSQFFCETLKTLDVSPSEEAKKTIMVFLNRLIREEICRNTSMLSEIAVLFECLGEEKPAELIDQINEMKVNLLHHGGYTLSSLSEIPDLVTTAKVLRTEECIDKEGLRSFLSSMEHDSIIGVCEGENILTNLRFYYYFAKLLCYAE